MAMHTGSNMTLDEARAQWEQTIRDDGGHCPCCNRWGKMYRRGINKTMAASIIWLARMTQPGGDWVDVPKFGPRWLVASNQLPTMRWWKMCERSEPSPEEDKKFSGMWRITDLGNRWATNLVRLPKFVWTYNDTVYGYDDPKIAVSEILENFSYNDVMGGSFNTR